MEVFLKCAKKSLSIHPEFEWEIVGTRQLWHFILILRHFLNHCILQFSNNSNTPHHPHNGSLQNHQNHPASPTFSRSQQKFLLVAICAYHLCNATREKSDGIASLQSLSDGFGILGSMGEVKRCTDGIVTGWDSQVNYYRKKWVELLGNLVGFNSISRGRLSKKLRCFFFGGGEGGGLEKEKKRTSENLRICAKG